jgi:hypothetical protein
MNLEMQYKHLNENLLKIIIIQMNIILDISQFNSNDIYYQEPVKNTIMNNSKFIRIIYSNSLFMMNGIYIRFNLNIIHVEKSFNKYKLFFDKQLNNNEIISISKIEQDLLKKINIIDKTPIYRISEQLANGNIKMFIDSDNTFVTNKLFINELHLKISGIWENDTEYGVTYRFY